jgi:hypothetical protein
MSCQACERADANPLSGRYQADCKGCAARALAQGPELFASVTTKTATPEYEAALTKVFGAGQEAAGHESVKQWRKRIKNHAKGAA